MSRQTHNVGRRSFLSTAAIVGSGFATIPDNNWWTNEQILEIVTAEEADLYYEFVVRGDVEGAETSDKISALGTNDALMHGNNDDTTIVRGVTGNPGYGDAYRIDGDLIFFEQTGGRSDFELRLDGESISPYDFPQQRDPTTPEPYTDIDREIDGVFGIESLERGVLYYTFVVRGDVENATINDKIDGDIGDNDATTTWRDSEYEIVRGFTGNPGYGDAYEIDGTLVSFRKDGGSVDYRFLLDGQPISLEELSTRL